MGLGEDILKMLNAVYHDHQQAPSPAKRDAERAAADRAAQEEQIRRHFHPDRGRYGEIIKPVTEATIVASEMNVLPPSVAPPTPPPKDTP